MTSSRRSALIRHDACLASLTKASYGGAGNLQAVWDSCLVKHSVGLNVSEAVAGLMEPMRGNGSAPVPGIGLESPLFWTSLTLENA